MPAHSNPIAIGEKVTALIDADIVDGLKFLTREGHRPLQDLALDSLRLLVADTSAPLMAVMRGYRESVKTHEELLNAADNVVPVDIELTHNDRLDLAQTCIELDVSPQNMARLAVLNVVNL